jgi:hypothetical protein
MEVIFFLFFIIVGVLGLVFPMQFAKSMAGGWGQKYTETQLKYYKMLSRVCGAICLIIGVLGLVGII